MQGVAGVAGNGRTNTVIAGNRTSFTSISMDGVNIQDNFIRSNATDFVPARPTVANVAEFTLVTQNQGTESGFGSNQVNMITPSGSNEFHGQAYLFNRNSALASNDFFSNRCGSDSNGNDICPIEFLNRNQYGFNVSGPVIKDKLLFFFNWEGQRIAQQSTQNTTILTQDMRNGIFTYNATDGTVQKMNIMELGGIPIDPYMSSYLGGVPGPENINNFDSGDSRGDLLKNTAGYRFNQRNGNRRDQYKFRVDYIINDSHSVEGIYQWLKNSDDRPDIDGTFAKIPEAESGTGGEYSDFFSFAWKWSVSPTLLNEVRYGAFLSPVLFTINREDPTQIASPGAMAAGFTLTDLPFTLPVEDFERQGRIADTYTFQDNASWNPGDHSFRFGFQSNNIRVNSFSCFTCISEWASDISPVNDLGLNAADFPGGISSSDLTAAEDWLAALGGVLATGSQEFNITTRDDTTFKPVSDNYNWEYDTYAFYFGDNWRLSPRLTLNMGLRWEFTPSFREKNDLIVQVVPTGSSDTAGMVNAVLDPNAVYDFIPGKLIEPDRNNLAPSLGIAWDMFGDSKTTLRAGYGISYVNDEAIRAIDGWLNREGLNATAARNNLTSSISEGLPSLETPEFELPLSLNTIAARDPGGKGTFGIPNDLVVPYVQTWNVSIGRELFWDTAIEFRYVGTKGTKMLRGVDYNQVGTRQSDFWQTGFYQDFINAQNNGYLAQEATGSFNATYNPNIPGSVPLPVFDQLPFGGLLTNSLIRGYIQQNKLGQLAYIYISNALDGGFPLNPNANANFSDLAINQASSTYHGGQIDVRRRFREGLIFNANYTFSKVLTDASGTSQTNFDPFLDINNPGYERGRAAFDLRHVFNANFIYQLPFGRGRQFDISNSFVNAVLGGWEVTSILQLQSGAPFSIMSSRGTLNRDGRASGRNNASTTAGLSEIKNLFGITEQDGDIFYINPTGITGSDGRAVAPDGSDPFSGQIFFHPKAGELGNLNVNSFDGPRYFNWDFSIAKIFGLGPAGFTEDLNIEFRAEFFNLPNAHFFDVPANWGISSTSFGQVTSTTGSPRIIQFGLKVIW
jgi:hypothetical protein